MFCPSCGAPNDDPKQRYCQECGTSLPTTGGRGTAIVHRPSDAGLSSYQPHSGHGALLPLPQSLRNRMLLAAGALAAAVVLLYVVVQAIIAALSALVPVIILLALGFAGFLYFKRGRPR